MAKQIVKFVIPSGTKMRQPRKADPAEKLVKKLSALFESDEDVWHALTGYGSRDTTTEFHVSDADAFFAIAEPVLNASELGRKCQVRKQYGPRKDSAYVCVERKGDRWEVVKSQGTKPKPKKPTVKKEKKPALKEARRLLRTNRCDYREKGFDMLLQLERRDEAVKHALDEPDHGLVGKIVDRLYPAPKELVVHNTMTDANLMFRYGIAEYNYIYAHDALADAFRPRKNKLHPTLIKAAGLAYCQSFAPFLESYLDGEVLTLEDAIIAEGRKEGRRDELASLEIDEIWSYETQCAINAAVALRQMDKPVEPRIVKRILADMRYLMPDCQTQTRTIAQLKWLLFDIGAVKTHQPLLKLLESNQNSWADEVMPDLLTTLLKRGHRRELDRVLKRLMKIDYGANCLLDRAFIHWPLSNYLDNLGLMKIAHQGYEQARSNNVKPPPWWKWENAN